MSRDFFRRDLFQIAGTAAASMLGSRYAIAQRTRIPSKIGHPDPFPAVERRSTVALVQGEERRKIICEALTAIDDQIRPKLKRKKYVVIKPNNVTTVNQLGATHADALHGILDYLAPRFKGPIYIAESSAGNTWDGYRNFGYPAVVTEHKKQKVSLVDLNEEAKYVLCPLIDFHMHVVPVRLAARLLDPEAFVLCAAVLKTHNVTVATLSVKNMVLGAPLHQAPKETVRWNDKRRYHVGIRQCLYNMFLTAQKMQPHWGATVIDGYEGMEGNGPAGGTPVSSRIAIASTDLVAADRVGAETMGIDADWLGWLKYCGEVGLGQWDLNRLDIRGAQIASVQKKYQLHSDIEHQLKWMGPMEELPINLGWVRPVGDTFRV